MTVTYAVLVLSLGILADLPQGLGFQICDLLLLLRDPCQIYWDNDAAQNERDPVQLGELVALRWNHRDPSAAVPQLVQHDSVHLAVSWSIYFRLTVFS